MHTGRATGRVFVVTHWPSREQLLQLRSRGGLFSRGEARRRPLRGCRPLLCGECH